MLILLLMFTSFIAPGLGHGLVGEYRRGVIVMAATVISIAAITVTVFAMLVWLAIMVFAIIDSIRVYKKRGALTSDRWVFGLAMFVSYIVVIASVRLFVTEAFKTPSSSMTPTLVVGDHLFISKLSKSPSRGDVIVFRQPCEPTRDYVKRVVGLAGDRIEVRCDVVYINGQAAPRAKVGPISYDDFFDGDEAWSTRDAIEWRETIDGATFSTLANSDDGDRGSRDFPELGKPTVPECERPAAAAGTLKATTTTDDKCAKQLEYIVPPGSLFVMGDNRVNSNDSRYWGAVPASAVRGRVVGIWLSLGPHGNRWSRFGGVR